MREVAKAHTIWSRQISDRGHLGANLQHARGSQDRHSHVPVQFFEVFCSTSSLEGRSINTCRVASPAFCPHSSFQRGRFPFLFEAYLAKGNRMHPVFPRAVSTHDAAHNFWLGGSVMLQSTIFNRNAARGAYEVMAQLPERDAQFEYRIKSPGEPHERVVVKESDLSSA